MDEEDRLDREIEKLVAGMAEVIMTALDNKLVRPAEVIIATQEFFEEVMLKFLPHNPEPVSVLGVKATIIKLRQFENKLEQKLLKLELGIVQKQEEWPPI